MNRRRCLKIMAAALPVAAMPAAAAGPIQLHCDLELDPARENEMLENYHSVFKPAIARQPGFVSAQLFKLRKEMQGKGPAGCSYRLIISFRTEEQRVNWVATADHQNAWPTVERTLRGQKYIALLYDPAD